MAAEWISEEAEDCIVHGNLDEEECIGPLGVLQELESYHHLCQKCW